MFNIEKNVLKLKRQLGFELALKYNLIVIFMLFQTIVRELVVFYVFSFPCITYVNYIFPDMSAV